MRKFTKPLLIVLAMILVCVTSVFGTLAYLQSQTKVVSNTFTVGNVEIDVFETEVDGEGKVYAGENGASQNYEDIVPAKTYAKDPTVEVKAGSESSYVRMFVTITKADVFDTIFAEHAANNDVIELTEIFDFDSTNWTAIGDTEDTVNKTRTYEFWYNGTTDEDPADDYALPALFENVTIPATLTNAELEALTGFSIDIYAEAIQAEGFASDEAAFEALSAAK